MVHPARSLAAVLGQRSATLAVRPLGALAPGVHAVRLNANADLLGIQWHSPHDAGLLVRFLGSDSRWSAWTAAAASGHGPDLASAAPFAIADPLWTGGTRLVQLRVTRPMHGVLLHLIDVSDGIGARRAALAAGRSPLAALASASLPLATPSLQAGAGQPPIIARRAWAHGVSHPRVAPEYGAVRVAFVHHTENPNGYLAREVPAMLRAIFLFHREVRGWNDIGYNFVVDAYGRTFEARAGGIDEPVVGAQAGGYNLVSTGVAVLGSFSGQPISAPARRALQRLLAWKLALHGVPAQGRVTVHVNPAGAVYSRYPANAPVSLPRIAGHRDADTTECPGDALYRQLPAIRPRVHSLAPRPVLATLALTSVSAEPAPPTPVVPPTPSAPPATPAPVASGGLAGTLTFLDGTPLAGASVQIQARSVSRRGETVVEQTLAQALCDAAGRWSLPASIVPSATSLSLRALYIGAAAGAGGPAGAGAAVSVPLALDAAALSVAPVPSPTPAAALARAR